MLLLGDPRELLGGAALLEPATLLETWAAEDPGWMPDDETVCADVVPMEDAPADDDAISWDVLPGSDVPDDAEPAPREVPPVLPLLLPVLAAELAVLLPGARLEERDEEPTLKDVPPDAEDDDGVMVLVATPPLELAWTSPVPHTWSTWQV